MLLLTNDQFSVLKSRVSAGALKRINYEIVDIECTGHEALNTLIDYINEDESKKKCDTADLSQVLGDLAANFKVENEENSSGNNVKHNDRFTKLLTILASIDQKKAEEYQKKFDENLAELQKKLDNDKKIIDSMNSSNRTVAIKKQKIENHKKHRQAINKFFAAKTRLHEKQSKELLSVILLSIDKKIINGQNVFCQNGQGNIDAEWNSSPEIEKQKNEIENLSEMIGENIELPPHEEALSSPFMSDQLYSFDIQGLLFNQFGTNDFDVDLSVTNEHVGKNIG